MHNLGFGEPWSTLWLGLSVATLVATTGVIAVVLTAGFNRRANRAIAIYLGTLVGQGLCVMLFAALHGSLSQTFGRMQTHFFFLDSLVLLAFLANYPQPRTRLPQWTTRLWPYLAVAALFEALVLWKPYLGFTAFTRFQSGSPLVLFDFLVDIAGSVVVPILLAREAFRIRSPHAMGPVALGAALVGVFVLYDASMPYFLLRDGLDGTTSWALAIRILTPLRLILELLLLAYLVKYALRPSPARRAAAFGAVVILVFFGLGALVGVSFAGPEGLGLYLWIIAVFAAIQVALLSYVALKDQVVGLNRKVRIGISRTALAFVFLGVFFVAAQVAQNFLSEEYGYLTGGVVAGMMLFVISPLQRATERLARVDVMPTIANDSSALQLYREAVRLTLEDREITSREELHLAHLAEKLGVGAGQAMQIRHEVQGAATVGKRLHSTQK